ncbi:MAG: aldehyde ferredoxin oxidoreductase N-terminal domain-containing protein, partial [Dehalococcoidia bacterium]|nr:aldehyde ferredoxin oxidoreductase N-terminal domain-containing protein [Dehalococcoidia bacterium]
MAQYHGWTGKTLRVDLTTGKISSENTMAKYKDYLGGTGLAYKVLWDEVPPGTKAWDPENRIIFGVGPLTGTGAPTSGRVSITSLWPMAPMELPASGHMGGHWGSELKFAGWDSIIVQGKASSPVWLYIHDDRVEIRDARWLWGQGIFWTTAAIGSEMGAEAHVAAIGQAGENLVRQSNIMCDRSHSAGGLGSVMGSKNLKAIGVIGSQSIPIAADKETWKKLVYEWLTLMGANSGGVVPNTPQPWAEYSGGTRWTADKGLYYGAASPPMEVGICPPEDLNKMGLRTHKGVLDFSAVDPDTGRKIGELITVRMGGCHSCPVRCHILIDLPSMETKYGLSRYSSNTCSGWQGGQMFNKQSKDPWVATEAKVLGSILADDYGVWNNYGQAGTDFQYAYKNGIIKAHLSEKEYNSIPWDLYDAGDPKFQFEYFRRIAYKEGELGEALGEGSYLLQKRWNFPEDYYSHDKKNWKFGHPYHHSIENSGQIGLLINLFYNRDTQNHVANSFYGTGLPDKLKLEIMNEITGLSDSIDPTHDYKPITPGKVRLAVLSLIYNAIHDSATMCDYNGTAGAWVSPLKSRNYRGDPDLEAKIFSAVTGD